jgi:tetratricopeptide (TPR) repeat protein
MRIIQTTNLAAASGRMLMLGVVLTALSCSSMGGLQGRQAASPDLLFQKAEAAYAKGDLESARQTYEQILKADPQQVEALFKLGVIDYREGHFVQSRTRFLKVLSLVPEHRKATFNLGVIYAAEGELQDIEKATFFFNKYLSLSPDAPQKEKIMRWKALQAGGKSRQEQPATAANKGGFEATGGAQGTSGDLKQWLEQEAEKAGP